MVRRVAASVFLLAALFASSASADRIGVASAVQNDVRSSSGALTAGSALFQDQTVSTGEKSMAQLIFLDETSLSLGPKSEVTLDKFVFDPSGGPGSVVLNATKGAFRFITGSQKPTNYQINTAVATIGVRGTIVDFYKTPAGLTAIGQEGKVVLVVNGVEYTLLPGQLLFIGNDRKVQGPMVPDGHFFDVVGVAPFQLYGAFLPGDRERFDVPDGSTVRLDEIFEHEDPCDNGGNYISCD